ASCCHLQLDRHGQTQRSRPRSISTRGTDAHRRSSHQPHRGAPPLEHRRHSGARRRTRRLDVKTKAKASVDITMSLPNIENLITDGDITLGVLRPVGCIATAADQDRCLAILVRRRGETLVQFLMRLDRAIDKALTEDVYTDEINPKP